MAQEDRSLWEQFDSEIEPWRRGRLVLVLIGLINLAFQALIFAAAIIFGETEALLRLAMFSIIFWLQFYFIWIGVNWIRWLVGAWAGAAGFAYLIWGWRGGNGFAVAFGCINLLIGIYLALSPSVYFFAKRQQERRNWLHSLAVAGIFVLLIATFWLGSVGLSGYRRQLEDQGRDFADEAFARIFTDHDTYFFLEHISERGLAVAGGRSRATKFLQQATIYAGDVRQIQRATTNLRITYRFPTKFECSGTAATQGVGERGPLDLRMVIVRSGDRWKFDTIWWRYRRDVSPPR